MYIYDTDLNNILITYKFEKLLKDVELERKVTELEIVIEKEILSVARNYEKGIYEKCQYMRPNEAYDCIRRSCEIRNKISIIEYIDEIENELNRMIKGEKYNKNLIIRYVSNIINALSNRKLTECEFRKYGREYELFNF